MERSFYDVMKEMLAQGIKNFVPQVGAELSRLDKLGKAELAHALFSGSAYTPYGQGQYIPTADQDKGSQEQAIQEAEPQKQPEQERDGRAM